MTRDAPIGYLTTVPGEKGFRVVGVCCANKCPHTSAVYPINVAPYRQTCIECRAELMPTKAKVCELFDGR
jgi:hypothetical protein